MMYC